MSRSSSPLENMDRLGAGLSLLCALHCAFHPLLLLALPVIGLGFLMNEQLETLFLIFSIGLAFWALRLGLQHHGQKQVLLPWLAGAALIGLSRLFHEGEVIFAVLGALALAGSHLLNTRYRRRTLAPQAATSQNRACC